jgi:hypothetical protein
VQRPQVELRISKELEDLLVLWEQRSSSVTKLRGEILRFTYDSVFSVEKRAAGVFWYQSPDMGRIDFAAVKVPDPGVNPDKKDANGKPYTIESDVPQKWICTGKQIFIIHDDTKMYDKMHPASSREEHHERPLPFLEAEGRTGSTHAEPGERHYPQGYTELANGKAKRPPQVHIVAVPKLEVDAREPRGSDAGCEDVHSQGVKLFNPQGTMERSICFRRVP